MQTAVPDVVRFDNESQTTREMYGLDQKETNSFGMQMLTARRLVERGVRFVQVYHGSNGGAGQWDSHKGLKNSHTRLCKETDQPIAALLKDLKQRGLLDETLVVWATEFGRTPGSQHGNGRDHHPYGFSVWMAGGGIRGGIAHGATDELRISRGRESPLRIRRTRDDPASTRPRPQIASNPGKKAPRERDRRSDPRRDRVKRVPSVAVKNGAGTFLSESNVNHIDFL